MTKKNICSPSNTEQKKKKENKESKKSKPDASKHIWKTIFTMLSTILHNVIFSDIPNIKRVLEDIQPKKNAQGLQKNQKEQPSQKSENEIRSSQIYQRQDGSENSADRLYKSCQVGDDNQIVAEKDENQSFAEKIRIGLKNQRQLKKTSTKTKPIKKASSRSNKSQQNKGSKQTKQKFVFEPKIIILMIFIWVAKFSQQQMSFLFNQISTKLNDKINRRENTVKKNLKDELGGDNSTKAAQQTQYFKEFFLDHRQKFKTTQISIDQIPEKCKEMWSRLISVGEKAKRNQQYKKSKWRDIVVQIGRIMQIPMPTKDSLINNQYKTCNNSDKFSPEANQTKNLNLNDDGINYTNEIKKQKKIEGWSSQDMNNLEQNSYVRESTEIHEKSAKYGNQIKNRRKWEDSVRRFEEIMSYQESKQLPSNNTPIQDIEASQKLQTSDSFYEASMFCFNTPQQNQIVEVSFEEMMQEQQFFVRCFEEKMQQQEPEQLATNSLPPIPNNQGPPLTDALQFNQEENYNEIHEKQNQIVEVSFKERMQQQQSEQLPTNSLPINPNQDRPNILKLEPNLQVFTVIKGQVYLQMLQPYDIDKILQTALANAFALI